MSTLTSIYSFIKHLQGDTPWTTEVNGNYDSIDAELARPRQPFNSPVVGATTTLDLSLARTFVFTVSQATAIAFTNVPTSSFTTRVVAIVTNGAAFALTWPASVLWLAGAGPTFRASGVDIVELITRDGGTTWYASKMAAGGTLFQDFSKSTASTSDVSLSSYSVPASTLVTNGQQLVVEVRGFAATQACTVNIKFGAAAFLTAGVVANQPFAVTARLVRTGAATQFHGTILYNNGAISALRGTPAETLANAVLLDFRGSVTAGGTLTYDMMAAELRGT